MKSVIVFSVFAFIVVLVVLITITISCLEFKGKLILDPKITNILNEKCSAVYFVKEPLPYVHSNTMHTSHWGILMKMKNNIYISISTSRYMYICIDQAFSINDTEFLYDNYIVAIVSELTLRNDITPLEWATWEINYYNKNNCGRYALFHHNCHTTTAAAIKEFCYNDVEALCGKKLINSILSEIFSNQIQYPS